MSQFAKLLLMLAFSLLIVSVVSISARADDDDDDDDDDSAHIKFIGTVESLPSSGSLIGDWQVSGRRVRVTSSTKIEQERGAAVVGSTVEVKGVEEADRSVRAYEIEVKNGSGTSSSYVEFYGVIESLPSSGLIGVWTVSGKRVNVTAGTQIKNYNGAPAVGKQVEVKGVTQPDWSILASSIEVKSAVPGTGYTQFYGVIESLPGTQGQIGDWRVSGKTVRVTPSTLLDNEHGSFSVGVFVEVEGNLLEGGVIGATKIEVKQKGSTNSSPTFYGTVELLPPSSLQGDWTVSGRTVRVDSKTKIVPKNMTPRVGSNVEIKGRQETDGSFTAKKIKVKS